MTVRYQAASLAHSTPQRANSHHTSGFRALVLCPEKWARKPAEHPPLTQHSMASLMLTVRLPHEMALVGFLFKVRQTQNEVTIHQVLSLTIRSVMPRHEATFAGEDSSNRKKN